MRGETSAFSVDKSDQNPLPRGRGTPRSGGKSTFVAGLVSALALLSACGGGQSSDSSAHPNDPRSAAPESGKVKGAAVNTQNRPLSGAKIDVCSSVFYESCVRGATGSDGSYSLPLTPNNVWVAYGSITQSYDGKTFCLPLAIDNVNSFASTDATIRNFSWKLSGLIPGQNPNGYASSYFGATLNVAFDFSLDRNRVRLNFAPNGPLIDGSAGTAFSAVAGEWGSNAIGNIPVGVYTVTAEYVQSGGAPVPLRITTNSFGSYGTSASVHFTPDSSSCLIAPEAAVYLMP